ncbi:MAG: Mov34/MPN/PAD-1 family protein [Kouleothrix sp.]|nr:Mov34/MPN/PAD-1 family protein [Kouleothrix sp.]
MSTDLAAVFASLQSYHVARPAEPLPAARPGVTWIWAANGVFKRGVDAVRDILIQVTPTCPTPGLAQLVPHVRYTTHAGRIPGALLSALLEHARRAGDEGAIARPIEQQYFVTYRAGLPRPFRLALPAQDASAVKVQYALTVSGTPLVDLHSHHGLGAFFSDVDDRDDMGLSISAVVGQIFDRPKIALRANVYGHRQRLPALAVFDCLPDGLCDTYRARGVRHAHADD